MVERILAAGRTVVLRDGYDAASTNRIANEAGVSPGSLYQYFPNKDAVLNAIVGRYSDDVAERITAALADRFDETGPEMVRATLEALLDALEENVELLRVVADELPRSENIARAEALEQRVTGLMSAYLAARPPQMRGDLAPTTGRITLNGTDITGWPPERVSRAGLGRSYQKTNIFLPFTVWDNVRLAAQSRAPRATRWLTRASGFADTNERAARALELAGLTQRRDAVAGTTSHGEQRQLEIAMTLATEPRVLLLDEPLAGMGTAEAERMVALLQRIKSEHAVLLVEHDMDAVFALADQLTVMVNGQVIASGTPDAIRADANVQAAYLGEGH